MRLDLARSTVERIVGALIDEGLLISAGRQAGVTLGPAITRLAAAAIIDTEKLVRPVLQEVSAAMGETVDLLVLQGDRAVFVDQVMGQSWLVAVSAIGEMFPVHYTANGKALLSLLPCDRRDPLLTDPLQRYSPNTLTDRAELDRDLADAQATGLAWDIEEHAEGICAVGMAFVGPLGRDFAVSIPVPAGRFEAKRADLAIALCTAGDKIVALIPGARTGLP